VHDATTQTPETEKDQFASKNKLRSTSPKARRRHYTKQQGERMSAETLGTVSERRPGHGGEYKEAQKKW
jgi:hypothetical protein